MEKYQFKTNIKCGGCIANVTPFLNEVKGIASWEVDTTNPDKILTVNVNGITANEVIEAIQKAGYQIDMI